MSVFFDLPTTRVDAAIHAYEDSYFFSVNDAFIYRGGREGLFKSSNDDDRYNDFSDWGVKRPAGLANGKSYIRFNKVAFRRSVEDVSEEEEEVDENKNNANNDNDEYSGVVQAVVFEVNDRDLVGYVTEDGGRRYCCDEALAKTSGCSPGRVIVRPKKEMQEQIDEDTKEKKMVEVENVDWPWVTDAYFEGKNELESRTVDGGEHRRDGDVLLVVCDLRPEVGRDDGERTNGVEKSERVFTRDDGGEFAVLFVLIVGVFSARNLLGGELRRQVEVSDANPSLDDVCRLVRDD